MSFFLAFLINLIRLAIRIATLVLWLFFIFHLLGIPGPNQTLWLFRLPHPLVTPCHQVFNTAIHILTPLFAALNRPVQAFVAWLNPFLPAGLHAYFPGLSLPLGAFFPDKRLDHGLLDWTCLLSIFLWEQLAAFILWPLLGWQRQQEWQARQAWAAHMHALHLENQRQADLNARLSQALREHLAKERPIPSSQNHV